MAMPQTYKARLNVASPTASATLPILQLALAAGHPLEIWRLEITNETSTTSAAAIAELVTSTAVAPGTLTLTNAKTVQMNPADAAANFTLKDGGFSGSLTGNQTVYGRWGFNVLNGLLYLPVPEERIIVPAVTESTNYGAWLWIRMPTAPAATYNIELTVRELG